MNLGLSHAAALITSYWKLGSVELCPSTQSPLGSNNLGQILGGHLLQALLKAGPTSKIQPTNVTFWNKLPEKGHTSDPK